MKKNEEIFKQLIEDEYIDIYIRYLGALKIIESDYGLFDKLARPRDLGDFVRTIYSSIRVQERVLKKLEEGLNKDYELAEELNKFIKELKSIDEAFRVNEECVSRIIEIAKENPRFVGSIIASLALAYEGIKEKKKGGD
ncbi:MAG: hypothetical protein NZ922_06965 [Candidatus Methanomethyliaceae archaeon]|nr:hypothetical protein [Candidatus Methanomethyliaceae archaeon]